MTDPVTGAECVTVNTPAGERHLKPLAPADWTALANFLRAFRKAQKRAEMRADGAKEEDVKKAMDAIDRRPVRYADVEQFINSVEGQYEAILLSLRQDNAAAGDAEFAALRLHPADWLRTVARLCDLKVEDAPAEGAADPLAGSGGPAESGTSNTSSTSSASTSTPPPTPASGPSPESTPP